MSGSIRSRGRHGRLIFLVAAMLLAAGLIETVRCRAASGGGTIASNAQAPLAPVPAASAPATTAADPALPSLDDAKRVVMLGFDGGSFDLVQRFIAEGRMPNCRKLEEQGTFLPLGSSNPAESPVAWASINTGMNPGKTNIFGFIRRTIVWTEEREKPGAWRGSIQPAIGYNRTKEVPYSASGGEATTASATLSTTENDLRAKNFWSWLDDARLESRILQAACSFPAEGGPHTHLLAGLSVPDVRGGPGTYLLYTNEAYEFNRGTDNGGSLVKYRVVCPKCKSKGFTLAKGCPKCNDGKKVGWFETKLCGPTNFVQEQQLQKKSSEARERLKSASEKEKPEAQKQLNIAVNQQKQFEEDDEKRCATVPISGFVDRAARTIQFSVGGRDVTVKEGGWSSYLPVTFQIEGAFAVPASVHLHVAQCDEDKEDVLFYLPAITVAADSLVPNMRVASPPEFGKELVSEVGYFDTIGWACQTHVVKDELLDEPSFLSAIEETIQWRRRMLEAQLAQPGWSTLFQVFGETDRVCHMMYRFFDPKHPKFDADAAARKATFFGKEIAMKDAIPAVYEQVDRTIGIVLDRIEKGQLGPDATLLVCSDHGFATFREQVELNAWLIDQGFLAMLPNLPPPPDPRSSRFPLYVDWSKTKAYSMGLGSIFLNLKGREPDGIVDPKDYDAVCDDILAHMRAYQNPRADSPNDKQVFKGGWKRSQFLAGDYAGDIRDAAGRCVEGAADLQVGLNLGYRVGWGTSLGDREPRKGVVFNNNSRWSGDHTTVHPALVKGIFFSNKRLAGEVAPHVQDLAPTILALHGVKVPDEMDGRVLPLPGLESAAKAHKGGTANRESVAPVEW